MGGGIVYQERDCVPVWMDGIPALGFQRGGDSWCWHYGPTTGVQLLGLLLLVAYWMKRVS
jgi:hypothetical protein